MLLAEVKEDRDPARRISHAMRLRKLMDCQIEFTVREWLAENKKRGMN